MGQSLPLLVGFIIGVRIAPAFVENKNRAAAKVFFEEFPMRLKRWYVVVKRDAGIGESISMVSANIRGL